MYLSIERCSFQVDSCSSFLLSEKAEATLDVFLVVSIHVSQGPYVISQAPVASLWAVVLR